MTVSCGVMQVLMGYAGKRLDEGAKQRGFVKKLLEMAALHLEEGDYTARLANV